MVSFFVLVGLVAMVYGAFLVHTGAAIFVTGAILLRVSIAIHEGSKS